MPASAVTAAALVVALSSGDLVQNGDFARGATPGAWITVRPGGAAIAGWRVLRGDVDYVGTYWRPASGARSVNLDGATAGAIAQTLATVPGTRYRLRFDVAPNPEGPPAIKRLRVSVGGTQTTFDVPTPAGATRAALPWTTHALAFTATSASTELEFASLDRGAVLWNGPVIAAVSVVAEAGEPPATAVPHTAPPATAAPATAAPATAMPATAAPRTPAPRTPLPRAAAPLGFGGTWLATYPGRPVRLSLTERGAHVVAKVVEGQPTFFTGDTAFVFDAKGMSLVGLARCPGSGGGWHGATFARTTTDQLVLTIADCPHSAIEIDRAR